MITLLEYCHSKLRKDGNAMDHAAISYKANEKSLGIYADYKSLL
jgi:hypothetical protein